MNDNKQARKLVEASWQPQFWPGTVYVDGGREYSGRLISPTGLYERVATISRPMAPGEGDLDLGKTRHFTDPSETAYVGLETAVQEASIPSRGA